MKSILSGLKSIKRTNVLSFIAFIVCMSALGNCNAQTITGKWKEVSMKNYFTAQAARESGEKFTEHPPYVDAQILIIKADHSFTTTQWMNWIPGALELTGTWNLAGNQLNTKLDTHQADPRNNPTQEAALNIYTLTIMADHLVLTLPIKNNPYMEKMEKTYVRM
jgi:hypothetical protein